MVEGRNPLIAYLKACERNHIVQSHTRPIGIKKLRQAWNAFGRLLDINPHQVCQCPLCGPEPAAVICDGTMIGFRKDFLPSLHQPEEPSQPTITGSKHSERILVSNARARSLLLKYAGISKDRRHISCPKQLSEAEFRELCQLTRKDIPSLAAFIKSLRKEHDKKSPPQYRQFFFRTCTMQSSMWNLPDTRKSAGF